MNSMFEGCTNLKSLNLNVFKTPNLKLTDAMFKDCSSLTDLKMDNFNTYNVQSMNEMFSGVSSLRELSLPKFYTNNIQSYTNMWKGVKDLNLRISVKDNKKILDGVEGLNITNIDEFEELINSKIFRVK